jgi:protein neuralized
MGSSHSSGSQTLSQVANGAGANPDAPPLKFHRVCGENIQLESDGFCAQRFESFCKGILFSDRPVAIGERVCIRLTDLSSRWSGVLRVGFSAHNPALVGAGGNLPKYACPDLTSKPGYWAKALSDRYSESNSLIHYHVSANGDVHFGINGKEKGVFFSGVDTQQQLWALVDLYGNCTGLELVDLRTNLNNFHRSHQNQLVQQQQQQRMLQQQHNVIPTDDPSVQFINGRMAGMTLQRNSQQQQRMMMAQHQQQFVREQQQHQYPLQPALPQALPLQLPPHPVPQQPPPALPSTQNFLPLRHNLHAAFRPLCFHFCAGNHVQLSESSMVATRHEEEFAHGYTFTAAPIRVGERIVVQILGTESSYIGSLAFGLTNADPSCFDTRDLPEDADLLIDRPEYWVVSKAVAGSPEIGDELSFLVRPDGSVEFSKNGQQPPTVFMHVDTSLRLWAFFDLFGNTSKIRILGSTADPLTREQMPPPAPIQPGSQMPPPLIAVATSSTTETVSVGTGPTGCSYNSGGGPGTECTVCCERPVDCVIYTCGHMCMCFTCAMQQWKGRGGGFCPMCREHIRDVIRTYRA